MSSQTLGATDSIKTTVSVSAGVATYTTTVTYKDAESNEHTKTSTEKALYDRAKEIVDSGKINETGYSVSIDFTGDTLDGISTKKTKS